MGQKFLIERPLPVLGRGIAEIDPATERPVSAGGTELAALIGAGILRYRVNTGMMPVMHEVEQLRLGDVQPVTMLSESAAPTA